MGEKKLNLGKVSKKDFVKTPVTCRGRLCDANPVHFAVSGSSLKDHALYKRQNIQRINNNLYLHDYNGVLQYCKSHFNLVI